MCDYQLSYRGSQALSLGGHQGKSVIVLVPCERYGYTMGSTEGSDVWTIPQKLKTFTGIAISILVPLRWEQQLPQSLWISRAVHQTRTISHAPHVGSMESSSCIHLPLLAFTTDVRSWFHGSASQNSRRQGHCLGSTSTGGTVPSISHNRNCRYLSTGFRHRFPRHVISRA